MALLRCDFCGEPFSDHIEHWTKGNLVFCSKNCLDSYVEKHSVCCEECGGQVLKSSSIYRDGHYFCSEICYDRWQFKQWQKNEEKEAHEEALRINANAADYKRKVAAEEEKKQAELSKLKEGCIEIDGGLYSPDRLTFMGCSKLTRSINILDSVVEIYEEAFRDCKKLESVHIPASVKTIGKKAFMGCTALSSVTFEEGLEEIGYESFKDCESLSSITLPASLKQIANGEKKLIPVGMGENSRGIGYEYHGAFIGCSSLEKVTLLGKNTKIGDFAFYEDNALETVEGELINIGRSAFEGCKSLANISLPEGCKLGVLSLSRTGITSISIPKKLTWVTGRCDFSYDFGFGNSYDGRFDANDSNGAFYECSKLTSVKLGEGVTLLGPDAFHSCGNITSVELPSSLKVIDDGAFYKSGIKEIAFPENLEKIGEKAFCKSKITSISFPNSIKEIAPVAFAKCSELQSVTIPCSIKTIAHHAFSDCEKLESVILEEGVEEIEEESFKWCKALNSVTSPKSLKKIADDAFYDTPNLKKIPTVGGGYKSSDSSSSSGRTSASSILNRGFWANWSNPKKIGFIILNLFTYFIPLILVLICRKVPFKVLWQKKWFKIATAAVGAVLVICIANNAIQNHKSQKAYERSFEKWRIYEGDKKPFTNASRRFALSESGLRQIEMRSLSDDDLKSKIDSLTKNHENNPKKFIPLDKELKSWLTENFEGLFPADSVATVWIRITDKEGEILKSKSTRHTISEDEGVLSFTTTNDGKIKNITDKTGCGLYNPLRK